MWTHLRCVPVSGHQHCLYSKLATPARVHRTLIGLSWLLKHGQDHMQRSYCLIGAVLMGMLSAALAPGACTAAATTPGPIPCRERKLLGRVPAGGGSTGTPSCIWGAAEGARMGLA